MLDRELGRDTERSRPRASLALDRASLGLTVFGVRETITFRPKRPKSQLQAAFGNVSEKLNELVERELALAPPPDW